MAVFGIASEQTELARAAFLVKFVRFGEDRYCVVFLSSLLKLAEKNQAYRNELSGWNLVYSFWFSILKCCSLLKLTEKNQAY